MNVPIEEQYPGQLACLEAAVVSLYRQHPSMPDSVVDDVYAELAKRYRAEATAHTYKASLLDGLRSELYTCLLAEAEALVGRGTSNLDSETMQALVQEYGSPDTVTAAELTELFKRLRKSIKTFSSLGRHGYLDTVSEILL